MIMKNIMKVVLVSNLIYILLTVGFCAIATNAALAEVYPLTSMVISLDYDTDVMTVLDFSGNEWEIEGCEDWELFDLCAMVMEDNDTNEVYDDIIIKYRYSGRIECFR